MPRKKKERGRETTTKGGRPINPSARQIQQAEVVRLRTRDGLSWPEIAIRLGISRPTAAKLYNDFTASELGTAKETVEHHRAVNGAVLGHLRDINYAMARDTKIKVTKEDPDLGSIDLADFEKVVKCSKVAIDAAVAHAKLFGCNAPEEHNISGGLSLAQFAALAEAGDTAAGR